MSYNAYLFVVDETITVDEDYFETKIVLALLDLIIEIGNNNGYVYVIKKSPLQKRFYWKLKNMLEFDYPLVNIISIDEYCPQAIKEDCNYNRIALDFVKYANYIDDEAATNKVISYIKNKNSEAAKIVEKERVKGNKIIDLVKKTEEQSAYIKEKISEILEKSNVVENMPSKDNSSNGYLN